MLMEWHFFAREGMGEVTSKLPLFVQLHAKKNEHAFEYFLIFHVMLHSHLSNQLGRTN